MMGVTFSNGLSPGTTVSYRTDKLGRIQTATVIQIDTTCRQEYYLRDVHTGEEFRRSSSEVF
jgi:hypothetical protein